LWLGKSSKFEGVRSPSVKKKKSAKGEEEGNLKTIQWDVGLEAGHGAIYNSDATKTVTSKALSH